MNETDLPEFIEVDLSDSDPQSTSFVNSSHANMQAAVAMRAAWFLLIFPTAYFLHIGYTESLFLALVLGSFLAARTDRERLRPAPAGIRDSRGRLGRLDDEP